MSDAFWFYQGDINLSDGRVITILSTIKDERELYAAAINWQARHADNLTPESFCEYINNKGVHTAMTLQQYDNEMNEIGEERTP